MNKNTMNCSVCRKKYDCKGSNGPDDWCTKFKSPIMRNVMWALLLFGLFLLVLFLTGCTTVSYPLPDGRQVTYQSVLTDRKLDSLTIHLSDGTTLELKEYTSEQSKVVEAAIKAALMATPAR